MATNPIEQRVRRTICEVLARDNDEVTLDSKFAEMGDSLDMIELVMAMEEVFEIEISDEDAERVHTVRQAVDYIGKRVGNKWGAAAR